jgi:hypothetical protein
VAQYCLVVQAVLVRRCVVMVLADHRLCLFWVYWGLLHHTYSIGPWRYIDALKTGGRGVSLRSVFWV